MTISGPQSFQLLHALAMQGLVVIDAMNRQQAFDPVDVLDSFADQPATLTMKPTVVLFGNTRHAHNAPDLWLTTQIRHQRSQQSLDINSVRLGSARPTINLHTRRIDDVVAYALRFEQTVEPEAVIARFVATNHIHAFLQFSSNARPNPLAQLQKLLPIAGLQRVAANLVRQRCVRLRQSNFSCSIRLQEDTV